MNIVVFILVDMDRRDLDLYMNTKYIIIEPFLNKI